MLDVSTKFELNLNDPTVPIPVVTELAAKHNVAAVIVHDPALIHPMIQARLACNGRFKVILAVDFVDGEQYAMAKFRNFTADVDVTAADGFDIRLSTTKAQGIPLNEIEVFNEVKVLRDFLYGIKNIYDIRYTIDIFSRPWEQVEYALKAIAKIPCNMIRLDRHLNIHESKVNSTTIANTIEQIRRYTATPIKLSTNVDRDLIDEFKSKVARFDVTPTGLQQILLSYEEEPAMPESHTVIENTPKGPPVQTLTQEELESANDELPSAENLEPMDEEGTKEFEKIVKPDPTREREMVSQPVKATKGVISEKKEPHQMKVQKSLEVNMKQFTDSPKDSRKQGTQTVTPPPKNVKKK